MTPALLKKLGVENKLDFVDKFYDKIEDGSLNVRDCAKMLFLAVIEEDEVAAEILRDIAVSYANGVNCMIEEMKFDHEEDINIVFAGSVFVKSEHPLLIDTIKEKVRADNPAYNFKYTRLNVPPAAGAVIWALNTLNEKKVYYDKVCAQFRNE
jgi:N-acetylglucosamine kinase-like BadF-type ATPase